MTKQIVTPESATKQQAADLLDKACVAPADCTSMAEIRDGIDTIDRALACLLAERQRYVEQAGHVKQSRDAVRDEPRVEDVVSKATAALVAHGGSAELADAVWRTMVEWFIAHEFTVYDDK